MSFEGMDLDQLQGLAKQIDSDAQKLYGLVGNLADILSGLTLLWNGPVAATFEQDWQSKNRPALLAAYNTLMELHAHLVSNISQQTAASAADGGWSAARVFDDFENVLTGAGLASLGLSGTKLLEETPVGDVFAVLDPISMGIGIYHTGKDAFDTGEELAQGHYVAAANDFTDGVADGLQTFGGPVGELAGIDVKLADQVANLDWKDTPNPFSGSNFQQDYVPVLKSMGTGAYWEQAGQVLWGDA
jgi:uncharacterized protein YukE